MAVRDSRLSERSKWTLVKEVVEVESGKFNYRPELAPPSALRRVHGAKLLIAKLDPLPVRGLNREPDGGWCRFEAVELPQANRLTLHAIAEFAHEAKAIPVLAAEKARGRS